MVLVNFYTETRAPEPERAIRFSDLFVMNQLLNRAINNRPKVARASARVLWVSLCFSVVVSAFLTVPAVLDL